MVLKRKYQGNTLPEVLIAIVIISFTSVLGITIYLNIQKNSQPFLKLKANEIAREYLVDAEQQKDYIDKQDQKDDLFINKLIKRSEQYPDCIILEITVSTAQRKELSKIQKIIYAKE